MKYKNLIIRAFLFVLFLGMASMGVSAQGVDSIKPRLEFKMISVPDTLRSTLDRANYVVSHYWDNFNFSDTAYVNVPEVTEQAFANYVGLASYASPVMAISGIKTVMQRASVNQKVFGYFSTLFEKYLYEPNSPMHNEELYIPVLQYLVDSPQVDGLRKQTYQYRLKMALKNRKGTQAADIEYEDRDGVKHSLQESFTDRDILLVFFDPDCEHCKDVIGTLKANPDIMMMTDAGTLAVVAIYAEGKRDVWNAHKAELPAGWTVGYDLSGIYKHTLYDLKAMPTLYVLDKNKIVLIKDANLRQIQGFLKDK